MFDRGTFHCDECPEHIETGAKEFDAAMQIARAAGWRAFKGPDKKWAHACPGCVQQFAADKRNDR